jgi:hypothetical protein
MIALLATMVGEPEENRSPAYSILVGPRLGGKAAADAMNGNDVDFEWSRQTPPNFRDLEKVCRMACNGSSGSY